MDLIRDLKHTIPQIKDVVEKRKKEFLENGKEEESVFKELCFCLLTANFSAYKGMVMQREIGDGFIKWDEDKLTKTLADLGHRFPNARARYIVEARRFYGVLKRTIEGFNSGREARGWLVKNIKGLGMKESSHFLRNIGIFDVAILDFHIIDLLERYGVIERPKTLTPKRYEEIERVLEKIAKNVNLTLGELDLYLWYMETGKVLK